MRWLQAGVHNNLGEMVEGPMSISAWNYRFQAFNFAPDTLTHLGGSDVVKMYEKYKNRLSSWITKTPADYSCRHRVAKRQGRGERPSSEIFESIYDLGDGDIDFSLPSHFETDRFTKAGSAWI
jgi:hypothetical protein